MNDTQLMLWLLFYAIDDYVELSATDSRVKVVKEACKRTAVRYLTDRDMMTVQIVKRLDEVAKGKAMDDFATRPKGEIEWTCDKTALKLCMDELCKMCRAEAKARGDTSPCVNECETIRIAKAALAKPARNCDVFTVEGLVAAFDKYCNNKCSPQPQKECFKCAFKFAIAEYRKAGA